jgi:hypothetical protein
MGKLRGPCPSTRSMTRLDEYDEDEWWDVCRRLRPDLDRETFETMWTKFAAWKASHQQRGSRQ